ncbi:MAG: DUF917 domain-containing protein [Halioglobus sp.]
MSKLGRESLEDLSAGAVFLATGGGGDPYVAQLIAEQALARYGEVELLDPTDLADDAYVVAIGGVGAPTVSLELLPSINEARDALLAFEQTVGRKVDAVVSFEIGGGNSLIPIVAAAAAGLPIIDGDGMGRALPEAQMMTYPITGVLPTPAVAIDYKGCITEFDTTDIMSFEREIRQCAISSGGMITSVEHPMTGLQLKQSVIPGTVSFSIALGRVLRLHRGNSHRIFQPLAELFSASIYGDLFHLYTGKVVDSTTKIIGGYDIGQATIAPFTGDSEPLVINIKNEYLVASRGEQVLASVPDLITIVDYETSTPINAERLRFGQRISVFGVGCPQFYRSQQALEFVAPKCFGFPMEYQPVEDLMAQN